MHKCKYCGQPANHSELLTDEWYCPDCVEKARDKWLQMIYKIIDYR